MNKRLLTFWVKITIGIILIQSCAIKNNMDDVATFPQQINFELIGKGVLHGAGSEGIPEGNLIIDKQENWQNLIEKMDASNSVSNNFAVHQADLNKFIIIACFDRVRPNGGYDLTINEIEELSSSVVVYLKHNEPSGMATSIMVQPFHIVMIPITSKKVDFKE